jgi:Zn-dependent protease/CBS domain-containing protein
MADMQGSQGHPSESQVQAAPRRGGDWTSGGLRIGSISGIEVRVHWSLFFIFWLIVVNLGAGLFPARHSDWSAGLSWLMAGLAAVLFFLSILAHELSHALVGRATGVPVDGITLFIFGGVARMRGEPPSPRSEFLMTIVGPLTSLAIGVIASIWGALIAAPVVMDTGDPLRAFQDVSPLATVLLWLGPINILIGLFNLVPGFPLDGGRVLRSILWAWTKDLGKATRWAATVGQVFALVLVVAGISMMFGLTVPFFGRGLVSGLWIAFIGWFLHTAAAASYSQVVVRDLLQGVPVERLMQRGPTVVDGDLTVAQLVDGYLMATDQRAFPVVEAGRPRGIITLEDVRRLPRGAWQHTRVRDVMTPAQALVTVSPDDNAADALDKLAARDIDQLPVVSEGQLVGLLRRRDILRWLELQPRAPARLRYRHA